MNKTRGVHSFAIFSTLAILKPVLHRVQSVFVKNFHTAWESRRRFFVSPIHVQSVANKTARENAVVIIPTFYDMREISFYPTDKLVRSNTHCNPIGIFGVDTGDRGDKNYLLVGAPVGLIVNSVSLRSTHSASLMTIAS